MKELKLQLQNIDGIVQEEKTISINDGDVLVVKYPNEMTMEVVSNIFRALHDSLESGKMIGIDNRIDLLVIKKG